MYVQFIRPLYLFAKPRGGLREAPILLEFDENGDVAGAIGHFIIENGAYKEIGLVSP